MRLIDGNAIIIDLLDHGIEGVQTDDYAEFQQIVENAPTVDAVPVVRCKDCKHWSVHSSALGIYLGAGLDKCAIHGDYPSSEYYCADGERKEGDER